MDNISQRIDKFIEVFIEQNGYTRVITGLENTLPHRSHGSDRRYHHRNADRDGPGCSEI